MLTDQDKKDLKDVILEYYDLQIAYYTRMLNQ